MLEIWHCSIAIAWTGLSIRSSHNCFCWDDPKEAWVKPGMITLHKNPGVAKVTGEGAGLAPGGGGGGGDGVATGGGLIMTCLLAYAAPAGQY